MKYNQQHDSGTPAFAEKAFPNETARLDALARLHHQVEACTACPRLRSHCQEVARVKRRQYRDWTYWGRPVPGFGDPSAELLIVGLAPAAHGANRTGRMFTGDDSGNWLYAALHRHGWANQAESVSRDDGLRLKGAYITAAARCAPPQNKPTAAELAACRPFLVQELQILTRVRLVLVLGRIALDAYRKALTDLGHDLGRPAFGHGAFYPPPAQAPELPALLCSYHPSRQNTQTRRLTPEMWDQVFKVARDYLDSGQTPTAAVPPTP